MKNNPIFISIIIIGYNSENSLKKCLSAISLQNIKCQNFELIYVDDGSTDNSVEIFNDYSMELPKKIIIHKNNIGRNHARNSGIKIAKGTWCFFTNSNIELSQSALHNYYQYCSTTNSIGVSGSIQYYCKDKTFETYLNNPSRGLVNFNNGDTIPPELFLFSNSCVKRHVFEDVGAFNKNLTGYGASELEMAYRIQNKFKNGFQFIADCNVIRLDHPCLKNHIKRIEEFGENNLRILLSLMKISEYKILFKTSKMLFSYKTNWIIPIFTLIQNSNLILIKFLPDYFCRFFIKFVLGISLLKGASLNKNN